VGYEIKLLIGHPCGFSPEHERTTTPIIEGKGENAYVWYPHKKDGDKYIETGREESTFLIAAMVDLCKVDYSGPIHKLRETALNTDKKKIYKYFTGGNTEVSEDSYGDKYKPVAIGLVIKAIEEEIATNGGYRRLEWALKLLRSVKKTSKDEFSVLFCGH